MFKIHPMVSDLHVSRVCCTWAQDLPNSGWIYTQDCDNQLYSDLVDIICLAYISDDFEVTVVVLGALHVMIFCWFEF